MTATLKADFDKLQTDIQAVRANSTVTPAQEQAVHADFDQIAQALVANGSTQQAAFDQLAALRPSGNPLTTPVDMASLTTKLTALESQGVSATLVTQTLADIQTLINGSPVTTAQQQTIQADIQAILKDSGGKIDLTTNSGHPGGPGFGHGF